MANVSNTKLSDVSFMDCKLLGINFSDSADFLF